MKISFRGYNRKEVDKYIENLTAEYEGKIASLNSTIIDLNDQIQECKMKIDELEKNKKSISDVLVDAVKHAQQIELDYKNRARLSDEHYCQKANEWKNKMQACQASLEDMKAAAKTTYQDLLERIDQFETWSIENVNAIGMLDFNNNFANASTQDVLNANSYVKSEDDNIYKEDEYNYENLQNEILSGINADLSQACKDLGITDEE